MKQLTRQIKLCWLQRVMIFVIGFVGMVGSIHATETYYYKATASIATIDKNGSNLTTAGGKVYVSEGSTRNPVYQDTPMTIEGEGDGARLFGNDYPPTKEIYFYASPKEGFIFKGWKRDNAGEFDTSSPYLIQERIWGRRHYVLFQGWQWAVPRTEFNCTAYFQQITGIVQAYPAPDHITRGTVEISNPDNEYGEEVTITAHPDASQGIVFLGWTKNNTAHNNYLKDENGNLVGSSFSVTVPANTTTYYAHFSDPAQSVYCILKNAKTGKYLSIYGDAKAGTHKSNLILDQQYNNVSDGYIFTNGLKMISDTEITNNPMIVFKYFATTVGGQEVGLLQTDVKMPSDNSKVISTNTLIGDNNHYLYFAPQNTGNYRIYTKYQTRVSGNDVTLNSYLCDDGSDYVTMQALDGRTNNLQVSNYEWQIIFLTENQVTGAFGANAKSKYTQDGLYYTTMYAPFAYKLLDGVNAYYLDLNKDTYHEDKGTLTLTQIASGSVVPAKFPVIIECTTSDDATQNRLLPVGNEDDYPKSILGDKVNNALLGYNKVYNSTTKQLNTVANDHQLMYVFSMSNDRLGFFHYSGANMTPNKAYLKLPVPLDELAAELNKSDEDINNIKFVFGKQFDEGDLNTIEVLNEVVDDADAPIYNLQGVQVTNPEKGVYIRGGKKYFVK